MKKILFSLLFLLLFTIGCNQENPPITQAQSITPTPINTDQYTITYQCQAGKNAFDLLKQNTDIIDYDNSDFGVFVKSINQIDNDNTQQKYWLYFVDGEMAMIGIDQYICKNNETIEWKYGAEFNN